MIRTAPEAASRPQNRATADFVPKSVIADFSHQLYPILEGFAKAWEATSFNRSASRGSELREYPNGLPRD